ncbi:hypothetical protein ENBRE01_1790 [Enteropsectra breve]|nr:hypothetical protein ENBRE01_1790 [Enteropsectra breve]
MIYNIRPCTWLFVLGFIPAIASEIANNMIFLPLDRTFLRFQFPEPSEVTVTLSELSSKTQLSVELAIVVTGQYRGWAPVVLGEEIYFGGEGFCTEPLKDFVEKETSLRITVLYPSVAEVCTYEFMPEGSKLVLKYSDRLSDYKADLMWEFGVGGKQLKMLDFMPLDIKYAKIKVPEPSEVSVKLYKNETDSSRDYILFVSGKYRGWEPEFNESGLSFGGEGYSAQIMKEVMYVHIPQSIIVLYPDVEEVFIYWFEPLHNQLILRKTERKKDPCVLVTRLAAERAKLLRVVPKGTHKSSKSLPSLYRRAKSFLLNPKGKINQARKV